VLVFYYAGVGINCSSYWSYAAAAAGVHRVCCEALTQTQVDWLQQTVHWSLECYWCSIHIACCITRMHPVLHNHSPSKGPTM